MPTKTCLLAVGIFFVRTRPPRSTIPATMVVCHGSRFAPFVVLAGDVGFIDFDDAH